MRTQRAIIVTEACSVTQNPMVEECLTRQRCDRNAAQMSAELGSNSAVLTLTKADAELKRLTLLKKNHLDELYVALHSVHAPPTIIRQPQRAVVDRGLQFGHGSEAVERRSLRYCPGKDPGEVPSGRLEEMC